ncbi:hypothetical protein ABI_41220 [Asticcacaulis biprosthecium C19]|uniref:Uncharacterized protein n=1 Tax=Asticcacaulis biprosthecium C19 TaxID=715226 RepID=F4QSH9_9CAUL|nr:hypothetical protein [Asticcacaulis biprosthecium]EGF89699.1 hypothetical protein ABI_41220 [Asticcacaulis biprosthecium C19]
MKKTKVASVFLAVTLTLSFGTWFADLFRASFASVSSSSGSYNRAESEFN